MISPFSRSYTRIFTSYSATFLSISARASDDNEAPEISRCVTSASRADSAMFSLVPFAWKYAHASTLFACACCIAWVMLPAFTLHSAMKVAMIATLSGDHPVEIGTAAARGWRLLRLLDRLGDRIRKIAHARMLPRKRRASILVPSID